MISTNKAEQIEELRIMVKEADRRRINKTDPLDLRMWHAECKGQLQAIFGEQSNSFDAWNSLNLYLIAEKVDDDNFSIADEIEPNSWETIEPDEVLSFPV